MATPTRIIDSHQHVFWHGRDDKGLVADMDEHGIELAWLLTWEVQPDEDDGIYHGALNPLNVRPDGTTEGIPLRDLILTRDRYPDRFVVGYCPHPTQSRAPELLRAAASIHGVRICAEWKFRVPFDDPRCLELYRTAGELKMPVVLHLDVPYLPDAEGKRTYQPRWYGGTVDNLERALIECPETNFIGHAPGFWREISGDCATCPQGYPVGPVTPGGRLYRLFDTYANLYADLSAGSGLTAMRRAPDNAMAFLNKYSDRIVFGRDYYGQELHTFLQTLDLNAEVTERIYHLNATRLLSGTA